MMRQDYFVKKVENSCYSNKILMCKNKNHPIFTGWFLMQSTVNLRMFLSQPLVRRCPLFANCK